MFRSYKPRITLLGEAYPMSQCNGEPLCPGPTSSISEVVVLRPEFLEEGGRLEPGEPLGPGPGPTSSIFDVVNLRPENLEEGGRVEPDGSLDMVAFLLSSLNSRLREPFLSVSVE
ncbi:hypothetical protein HanPSC8_Chr14g0640921 [Helianthus annuus]|nr:hypothetical protein HanPSC8_Chr14g0640921 [Helianthus annuus]